MKYFKYIFFYSLAVLSLILFAACDDLIEIGPEESETFVKFYGGDFGQEAHDLLIDEVGNFFMLGSSKRFKENDPSPGTDSDIYLVKAKPNGEVNWTFRYASDLGDDAGYSMIKFDNKSYLICGEITQQQGKQGIVMKLTPGNTQEDWKVLLGTPGESTSVHDIIKDEEDNFIVVGTTTDIDLLKTGEINKEIDRSDIFLASIQVEGNQPRILWQDSYGYKGIDEAYAITDLENGEYAVLGTTDFGVQTDLSMMVVTISPQGGITHTLNFGQMNINNRGADILCNNDQLMVLGTRDNHNGQGSDMWLLALSKQLDTLWSKFYREDVVGNNTRTIRNEQAAAFILDANQYLLIGTTNTGNNQQDNIFLIRADSLGQTISTQSFGSLRDDRGVSVATVPNSSKVAVLGTCGFGATDMFCLIKTDAE